ncbi:MAG: alcohol dehydrogenase catalytic domain-containing protein [Chloroflexia bacterium]|nr:alcohol dehydrogenase catalytic domain-containing protein [Chloroflexia bacterium]
MLAARFMGNQVIAMGEEPMPHLRPGDVLMRVAWCGLCGSDKRPWRDGFPLIPGHEVSGIVVDANGTEIPVGARAVAYLNVFCGECRYCLIGETNRCRNSQGLLGWSSPWEGGYAEYMAVPARDVLPVDDAIGLDVAVLLLDTIGTAWHGLRLADVTSAKRALVIGCGPLGLGAVAGLQAFGLTEIFACDTSEFRREAAADFAATGVTPDEVEKIRDLDLVVEAVGSGPTIMQSIRAVAPGGRVVMLGEAWQPWQFEPSAETMLKDYSIIRSWYFPISEYAENQQMLLDGRVDASRLISHLFPLAALPEAFALFASGASRKVLVGAEA